MDKSAVAFIIVGLLLIGSLMVLQSPIESIPPTDAIYMINTTSGNVTASSYNSHVEFVEGTGISITPDYSLNQITFTVTGGSGPKIFNQTAQNDFQVIGINNVTGVITTNQFSVNSIDCGTDFVQEINNVTGAITCAAGGGGGEANTMSSPTHANSLVLTKSGVDLPIKGIACGTGATCSVNSTDVTISASGGVSDGDKGDITVTASGATWTIDNNVVTYAKMQDVSATSRFLGRITAGSGDTEELTGTQATTLLDVFTTVLKGLVPSGGSSSTFLRGDATWQSLSGATSLGADVPCSSVSPNYCTVFTIPLTASSGNAIHITLVADSNTAGAAVQPRVIFDNAGNTGYCTFRTYTTATAEVLDVLAITTTTADTGETTWLAAANTPMPIDISCGLEGDATPGNAVVQVQMETASTGTVQKGSFYLKT